MLSPAFPLLESCSGVAALYSHDDAVIAGSRAMYKKPPRFDWEAESSRH